MTRDDLRYRAVSRGTHPCASGRAQSAGTTAGLLIGYAEAWSGRGGAHLQIVHQEDEPESVCGLRLTQVRPATVFHAVQVITCLDCRRRFPRWS